jgi:hypothetical protein
LEKIAALEFQKDKYLALINYFQSINSLSSEGPIFNQEHYVDILEEGELQADLNSDKELQAQATKYILQQEEKLKELLDGE